MRNLEHLDKELPDIIVSKDDKFYKMKNPENQSEIITVFPQKSNKPHILLDTNCIELEKVEVCDDKVYVRSAGIYQKIGGKYVFLDRTKEKTAYAKAKLLGLL